MRKEELRCCVVGYKGVLHLTHLHGIFATMQRFFPSFGLIVSKMASLADCATSPAFPFEISKQQAEISKRHYRFGLVACCFELAGRHDVSPPCPSRVRVPSPCRQFLWL
jgi:hypothetical protein